MFSTLAGYRSPLGRSGEGSLAMGSAVLYLLLVVAAGGACPDGMQQLKVQLQWVSQPQFAGFEMPSSRDPRLPSYADECLQVKVQPGGADWDMFDEVRSGRVDIGIANGVAVVDYFTKGENFTIIYKSVRGNPFRGASLKDRRGDKLTGAKVGAWCCGNEFTTLAMMKLENRSVKLVEQGFTIEPMFAGDVDVVSALVYNEVGRILQRVNPVTNFLYQLDEIYLFNPDTYPVPEMHMVAFVESKRLQELRPRLIRWLRVVNRAWVACKTDEEACVKNYVGDRTHNTYMMREMSRLIFPAPNGIGMVTKAEYDYMMDLLIMLGFVTSPSPPKYEQIVDMSMLIAAGAREMPETREPYDPPGVQFCAPYGSDDYTLCEGFAHTLCPAGQTPVGPIDGECAPCGAGRFSFEPASPSAARMLKCKPCQGGRFVGTEGVTSCDVCPMGYYSNEGMAGCIPCVNGSSTDGARGAPSCSLCKPGFRAASMAEPTCLRCPQGEYEDKVGSSACKRCPGTSTTEGFTIATSDADCMCPEGEYRSVAAGTCVQCPAGMQCPLGSDEENLPGSGRSGPHPTAKRGFMSLKNEPLKVYRCISEEHCPGGDAGACAEYRDTASVACGLCAEGAFEDGVICRPCEEGTGAVPIIIVVVILIACLLFMAVVVNRDPMSQSHAGLTVVIMVGLLVTALQTLGIYDQLQFDWAEPFASILNAMRFFCIDVRIIRVSCIARVNPITNYVLRQALMPVVIVMLFIIILGKKRFRPNTEVLPEFINTTGSTFIITFISLAVVCVSPLVCYAHPDSATGSSMKISPSTLCWRDSTHTSMVVLCIICFLLELAPFLVFSTWCTVKYPVLIKGSGSRRFAKATAFLFLKFAPHAYHDGLVLLVRGLLIALVPVIFQTASAQVAALSIVIMTVLVIQTRLRPWRSEFANFTDSASLMGLQLLLVVGGQLSAFTDTKAAVVSTVGIFTTIVFVAIIALCLGGVMVSAVTVVRPRGRRYSKFLCHHKSHSGGQARLLKILLQEQHHTVFIDSDNLVDLDGLFDIVRTDVDNMVVFLTRDTLRRPWCAGEVTTACRTASVKVTVIVTKTFVEPTAAEIADLSLYIDMTGCNLAQYGIHFEDIRTAYTQLLNPSTSRLELSTTAGTLKFELLVNLMLNSGTTSGDVASHGGARGGAAPGPGSILVSSDTSDEEATAAAGILFFKANMLTMQFEEPAKMYLMCNMDEASTAMALKMFSSFRAVVFMLSTGTLQSDQQLECFVQAATSGTVVVPTALNDFRYPKGEFYAGIAEKTAKAVKAVFNIIAVSLPLHSSDKLLDLQTSDIARRIPTKYTSPSRPIALPPSRPTTPTSIAQAQPSGTAGAAPVDVLAPPQAADPSETTVFDI